MKKKLCFLSGLTNAERVKRDRQTNIFWAKRWSKERFCAEEEEEKEEGVIIGPRKMGERAMKTIWGPGTKKEGRSSNKIFAKTAKVGSTK